MIWIPILGQNCVENGILVYLNCDSMCLNLSCYLKPASQVSIAVRISGVIRSNNDTLVGVSFLENVV